MNTGIRNVLLNEEIAWRSGLHN